jgi:GT2 family glycosyltransferase
MELSIIIINWNSKDFLKSCLKSIKKYVSEIRYEVIVVDNASFDGADDMIRSEFSETKYIQCEENIGFSKANNLGYKNSSGKVLLFLNPDTILLNPAINILYNNLRNLGDVGTVGAKLYNSDGSIQTSCIQPFPTIMNQLLDIEWFQNRYPTLKIWGIGPLFSNSNTPIDVEVVSGACIMIARNMFEEIALFSDDYFIYTEDIDLCYKVNNMAKKNYYVPEAEIMHYGGKSTEKKKESYFSIIMMRESIYKFLVKTKNKNYAKMYKLSMLITAVIRILIIFPYYYFNRFRTNQESIGNSIYKWIKIFRWSIGFENQLVNKYGSNLSGYKNKVS